MSDDSADRRTPSIAVVGGGITGLATAWYLRAAIAAPLDITVVEAADRIGGKIETVELDGGPVELGPDTFLARVPWAADLCRELGLGDDLISPATGKAYVWSRGALRPLPAGLVLGVPTDFGALARSGIVSRRGVMRAGLDLVMPKSRFGPDPSVEDVVASRLGREVLDQLVEPLVGGINAGRADRLSLRGAARQLATAAESRSIVLGARRRRRGAKQGGSAVGPVFQSVRGGLGRMVDRLGAAVRNSGTAVRVSSSVSTIDPEGERWRVGCNPAPDLHADVVVLTVPAFAAAEILRSAVPRAATELAAINYASVTTATLAYDSSAISRALDGSGYLVPRTAGKLMTACTWTSSKWPSSEGQPKTVLLRPSAGRFNDDRTMELSDDAVVDELHRELSETMGVTTPPRDAIVARWPRSFPQYEPGHEARVERAEAALRQTPGLLLAGAAYRGLGIASCIQQAERAAGLAATILAHHRPPS